MKNNNREMAGFKKDTYKRIIENLHDGLYFVDQNRVITYWNKEA